MKSVNHCKDFVFNPLDVFAPFDEDGNPRNYKPRKKPYLTNAEIEENLKLLMEILK